VHLFNVPLDIHFGDKPFQAIDCTGSDNQTKRKRKCTKHNIQIQNTNKPVLVKHKTLKNLTLKQFTCKICSYQCAYYDCAQLCYTIQHKTVLIIFPLQLKLHLLRFILDCCGFLVQQIHNYSQQSYNNPTTVHNKSNKRSLSFIQKTIIIAQILSN